MTLFRSPICLIDTETTGFPRDSWAEVIELAAVILAPNGDEMAHFESFVRPKVLDSRCEGALKVNNITPEMLEDAPRADAVAARFLAWAGNVTGQAHIPYCTSFNVDFDRPMVERMGLVGLRWANCVMLRASDVMGAAGVLEPGRYGGYRWPKLSHAAEFFGVEVVGASHRALTDSRVAAGIARAIARGPHA